MRLFIAVWPSVEVRDDLQRLQSILERRFPELKYSGQDQLHITMKFLGEVDEQRADEIQEVMDAAARDSAPFECELGKTECFPPHGKPRVVVAAIEDKTRSLMRIAEKLESGYSALGFESENREFRAHITIARVKTDISRSLRGAVESLEPARLSFPVSSLTLVRSTLQPKGAQYEIIREAPLGK